MAVMYYGFDPGEFNNRFDNPGSTIGLVTQDRGCGPVTSVFTLACEGGDFLAIDKQTPGMKFVTHSVGSNSVIQILFAEDCAAQNLKTPAAIWARYKDQGAELLERNKAVKLDRPIEQLVVA